MFANFMLNDAVLYFNHLNFIIAWKRLTISIRTEP